MPGKKNLLHNKKGNMSNKNLLPVMGEKVEVIKNLDKDVGNWSETWHQPKNRSPGLFPHSFRLLSLGAPGKGKTNYLKHIFLKHQETNKPFQRLIVVTCDLSSLEWSDCEPDLFLDRLPPLSLFADPVKTCLIIDDYEFEKCGSEELRKLTTLFRMSSSHKSVTIMASYQSFFHTPTICRKTANVFLLYRPTSDNELQTISNRVGVKYEDLKGMFKKYCKNFYDCLVIDMTKDTPYRIRHNVYNVIDYDSDSDAEE